jgi:hypothetical protein
LVAFNLYSTKPIVPQRYLKGPKPGREDAENGQEERDRPLALLQPGHLCYCLLICDKKAIHVTRQAQTLRNVLRIDCFVLQFLRFQMKPEHSSCCSSMERRALGCVYVFKKQSGFLPFMCINTGWERTASLPLLGLPAGICGGRQSEQCSG